LISPSPRGEIFGIIGRSGAGKSTLVRCLNLLERPSAGAVVLDGIDLTRLDGPALNAQRRRIGMIFQHFNLLSSRTAFGNVALPLEFAGRSKAEIARIVPPLLELVGLSERAEAYPAALSGGQKQRVGIARALATEPSLLLCDEATSALDPETTQSILALLRDINRKLGLTIVLITHEMGVVKDICDRVAVIEKGHLVEQGSVFQVFTNPQSETARSFVQDILQPPLPAPLLARLARGEREGGAPLVRISFTGPAATEPVLFHLANSFDVAINIHHGQIHYIRDEPFGVLIVSLDGAAAAVDAALSHLRALNLRVESLGFVALDEVKFVEGEPQS